jgi:hypothetical protein
MKPVACFIRPDLAPRGAVRRVGPRPDPTRSARIDERIRNVDPFRGDQKFPRSGERRKIGQPTKVSFASWIRSERYDPEGSRGPGGERTVEDKRRILSRELATGSGDDRAPLCIKAGRGREPKTERASDGLRIASKL